MIAAVAWSSGLYLVASKNTHFDLWYCPPMYVAYGATLLAVLCFLGAVRGWRFPLAPSSARDDGEMTKPKKKKGGRTTPKGTNADKQVNKFPPPESGNRISNLGIVGGPDVAAAVWSEGEDLTVSDSSISVPSGAFAVVDKGKRTRVERTPIEVRDPAIPKEGGTPLTEGESTIDPTAELMEKLLQVPKDEPNSRLTQQRDRYAAALRYTPHLRGCRPFDLMDNCPGCFAAAALEENE